MKVKSELFSTLDLQCRMDLQNQNSSPGDSEDEALGWGAQQLLQGADCRWRGGRKQHLDAAPLPRWRIQGKLASLMHG